MYFVSQVALPKAMTMDEIQKETQMDDNLCTLRSAIKIRMWSSGWLTPYKPIREELSIAYNYDIILRDTKIVLLALLQTRAIKIAHEGHQRQSKTTSLVREHVWFKNLAKMVMT